MACFFLEYHPVKCDCTCRDLGVHIDGFIATAAHTLQVQGSAADAAQQQSAAIIGKAADVVAAANTALEAALRLVRPGKHISNVPDILRKVVESYGCNLVEGVMTHQMKQFVIDANKCVLNRPSPEHRVEDGEFEENEVYAVDIVVSTGEGKPKVSSVLRHFLLLLFCAVELLQHARYKLSGSLTGCRLLMRSRQLCTRELWTWYIA